jgi:integrase
MGKRIEKPERLTTDFLRTVRTPEAGEVTYWDNDPKVPGFGVRVYAGGSKSFFLNYRIDGRERRHTIGHFPRWSATAARDRAIELRKGIDRGHDPASQKRERREAPTVQDLIDRYIEEHLPRKTAAEQRIEDEKKMLAAIGGQLGKHTKVADVHGGDIKEMHRKITESGRPVRANRVLSICSKMFSLSLVPIAGENTPWRNAVQGNPCKGIERNHEEGRERFFSQPELVAITDALAEYPGVAADCVRLIMLTGCRPAEAMQAEWSEFDNEAGYWIKPSAHTKQRKVHRLPLSPPAIELVDRLRKKRKGTWVFPGDIANEPLKALWHVWHFVRKKTGLGQDARVYDLRHTFASVGAGGGLGLPIIGKLLGHTQSRTTQRYAHLADNPLREAADKITAVIPGPGSRAPRSSTSKGDDHGGCHVKGAMASASRGGDGGEAVQRRPRRLQHRQIGGTSKGCRRLRRGANG